MSLHVFHHLSGWWNQTFVFFPFFIWDVILPIDELMFFNMVKAHQPVMQCTAITQPGIIAMEDPLWISFPARKTQLHLDIDVPLPGFDYPTVTLW